MPTLRQHLTKWSSNKDNTFSEHVVIGFAPEGYKEDWKDSFQTLIEIGFIVEDHKCKWETIYKLSHVIPVWTFSSTSHAYDMTQCDENIASGDIIHIPSEQVIGIADTWPIAITIQHGEIHTFKPEVTVEEIQESMNEYNSTPIDFLTSFKKATTLAHSFSYTVQEVFK